MPRRRTRNVEHKAELAIEEDQAPERPPYHWKNPHEYQAVAEMPTVVVPGTDDEMEREPYTGKRKRRGVPFYPGRTKF